MRHSETEGSDKADTNKARRPLEGGLKVVKGNLKGDFFMTKRYYIAYGSNLNVEQMKHRCPDARVVGTAALDGWTLLFKGSKTGSYLTIEPKEGESVPVAVWEVSERDELRLDRYEGYPTFYYKKDMKISYTGIASGKLRKKKAFVYIMHEDRPLGHPSDYYLKVCARGYRFFDFDINRLMQAVYDSQEDDI